MTRIAVIAGLVWGAVPGTALAAATSYDINVFLAHRDPVFDAFYGIGALPPPPPPAGPVTGTLYDMRIFLNQRDPTFDAFYGIGTAAAAAPPIRLTGPAATR